MTEPGAAPTPPSRRVPRSFMIIVFGPLVGALVVFAYAVLLTIIQRDFPPADDIAYVVGTGFLLLMTFGWFAGLPAAILSAIAWRFVGSRVTGPRRVLAALTIGAATSMLTAWPIFIFYFRAPQVTPQGFLALGVIGAVALAATALPGARSA